LLGFRLPPFCTVLQGEVPESSKIDIEVDNLETVTIHGNEGSVHHMQGKHQS
jgi:hypothetical protein